MTEKKKELIKKHILWLPALLGLMLLFWKCPLQYVLGIPCPGCGLTRATLAAVQLDFQSAFYYHPLWWLATPGLLYLVHRKAFSVDEKLEKRLIVLATLAFLGVYAYRLFWMENSPIAADFSNALFSYFIKNRN